MSLKGKTAIVTGSTSGIGQGIALALAKEGCNIVVNGFGNSQEIEKNCAAIAEKYCVEVMYHDADMSDPEAIRTMAKDSEIQFGKVDIVVNNAGIQHVDLIEDFPQEKWDSIIAINLSSAYHLIAATVEGMKKRKFGRIINIASAHGLVASAKKSAYVAAKHGLVGLTKVVALETAGTGVTANSICPGWVLTPLVQKQIDAIAKQDKISGEEAKIKLLSEKQPSKEFVHVEQLGALAVFLAGDAASAMTGASLSMDGGWTAQ